MSDRILSPDQILARDKVRDRLARHRHGVDSPTMSVRAHVLRALMRDADELATRRLEVAWYRARTPRTAWMPRGAPLDTDPPPMPDEDRRPRLSL